MELGLAAVSCRPAMQAGPGCSRAGGAAAPEQGRVAVVGLGTLWIKWASVTKTAVPS